MAAASPVKGGLMTEGDVPGRRDAEGAADSSDVVDREGVSLGDSLPLVGSWADCVVSSEEGDIVETVVAAAGGVRRPRDSSGEDLTESSAEVVPAESQVKGRRRRKKQREGTVQTMDRACDEERPSTSSGHSGVLDVDSGQEDSGSGSDVREGVPAPPGSTMIRFSFMSKRVAQYGARFLRRDCPSLARTYAAVAGGSETHKLRPLERFFRSVRGKAGPWDGGCCPSCGDGRSFTCKGGLMTE
ncbi:hypothetical protein D5F01_LYC05642 [Larimichthys crocea]|uniref:Uncharacterized protein n=1 Tax=Larimichthys crocea TaxID=215358 RepID=A0A6G0J069_LARCR|nr:hypothetical protein D5F01_LYC05642 [Larimichthys crocea]